MVKMQNLRLGWTLMRTLRVRRGREAGLATILRLTGCGLQLERRRIQHGLEQIHG